MVRLSDGARPSVAIGIQRGFHVFQSHGMAVIVTYVVVTSPLELDGFTVHGF